MENKIFINVLAKWSVNGKVTPVEITNEEGFTYKVERVLRVDPMHTLRGGGDGIRYKCIIAGREMYLYYQGPGVHSWYMVA